MVRSTDGSGRQARRSNGSAESATARLPAGALKAISRVTTVPYRTVIDAALADEVGDSAGVQLVDIRNG